MLMHLPIHAQQLGPYAYGSFSCSQTTHLHSPSCTTHHQATSIHVVATPIKGQLNKIELT